MNMLQGIVIGVYSSQPLYKIVNFQGVKQIYTTAVRKLFIPQEFMPCYGYCPETTNKLLTQDNLREEMLRTRVTSSAAEVFTTCSLSLWSPLFRKKFVVAKKSFTSLADGFGSPVVISFESVAKFWLFHKKNMLSLAWLAQQWCEISKKLFLFSEYSLEEYVTALASGGTDAQEPGITLPGQASGAAQHKTLVPSLKGLVGVLTSGTRTTASLQLIAGVWS